MAQLSSLSEESQTTLDEELSQFKGTLGPVAARYVIDECYDEYFGIYDHSSQGQSRYALVALHEPEDPTYGNSHDLYLDRYLAAGVLKYTGIDFMQFMELPRYRAEMILERCDEIASKEEGDIENLMNNLNNPKR